MLSRKKEDRVVAMKDSRLADTAASERGTECTGSRRDLREDAKRGVYVTPLKQEMVQSPTQANPKKCLLEGK